MKPLARLAAVLSLLVPAAVRAAGPAPPCPGEAADDDAAWVFEFRSGYFPINQLGPDSRLGARFHGVEYLYQAVRIGRECPHVFGEGTLGQGTVGALLEYNYLPILRDFGSYFTGPCAILRYSFRQDGCCLVPYVQAGAGLSFTDAHKDQTQELIGQATEFFLRAEVGLKFFLTECFSLDVEGGWQHVSNASLAPRNGGINNIGASVGFTYTFGAK